MKSRASDSRSRTLASPNRAESRPARLARLAPRLSAILVLSSALVIPAAAQKGGKAGPTATYKLIALNVTGTQQYTDKEILPAAGLQLGQQVGESDFKEAVRRLGDSGLFSNIGYTYSFSQSGMKLDLQLADIDPVQLVPAHFENFVWFTDEELQREMKARVPLFKQVLPLGGVMADRVEAALQALLDEKRIPARVDYLRESAQGGDKLIGFSFTAEAIQIRIKEMEFPGATPELLPGLNKAAQRVIGSAFLRTPLAKVAEVEFQPVCGKLGYLKARFDPANARVLEQAEGEVQVTAVIPLNPGKVYSTSRVTWTGNTVLKTDELQNVIHLPEAQPADAVRLQEDLRAAEKLYHTKGYMLAHIRPTPTFDDDKSSVAYTLAVDEGEQFKMGDLEIVGLDSQAKAHLQGEWKMAEGDPYNGEYAKQFLEKNTQWLPRGVPWDATIHEAVNEKDKTVDVTLRFSTR